MSLELKTSPQEQLEELKILSSSAVDAAKAYYIKRTLSPAPETLENAEGLENMLNGLETIGFDLERRLSTGNVQNLKIIPWKDLLWPAFRMRRALLRSSPDEAQIKNLNALFEGTLDGLLAKRQPELRLILRTGSVDQEPSSDLSWTQVLDWQMKRILLLMTRKGGDRNDLLKVQDIISNLRKEQSTREPSLASIQDPYERTFFAARTLALYYVLKALENTNSFLLGNSSGAVRGTKDEIAKLFFSATEILRGMDPKWTQSLTRLEAACFGLVDSSIFSITLPSKLKGFLMDLANRPQKPILELWHSQIEAINRQLLDPTKDAYVVSMPTSSGKTLLAELSILQALNDNPGSKVVYLAPTKALVTQVCLTFNRDFVGQNVITRIATPVFELDPVEDQLLKEDFNVLVTTPEKLDLLIRTNHKSVENISLAVVDEAHNIADGERGARLELLLATLRNERAGCRFLLMTPFAQNASELARWLGGVRGTHIVLDWKPNERVLGTVSIKRKRLQRTLEMNTLQSVHSDCPMDVNIKLGKTALLTRNTKKSIAVAVTQHFVDSGAGAVFLLAESPKDAMDRAKEIAGSQPHNQEDPYIDLVCRFLDTEVGTTHPLSALLRRRVAFHHAGLSPEARYFVERLVERGNIRVICATTTLAQGVHFPLSVAVIESFQRSMKARGNWRTDEIEPWEFWNIAGRVGRTLEDSLGTIIFPERGPDDRQKVGRFLQKDSDRVVSALLGILESLNGRDLQFNASLIDDNRPLSAFLQYLLHSVSVIGEEAMRRDLENIIRGSFVYADALRQNEKLAKELIRWARKYIEDLESRKGEALRGFAKIADETGFSSPSVDVMWPWRNTTSPGEWTSTSLFPREGQPSETLTRVMETLGRIPEVHLGTYESGTFDPKRVARITAAWVNGESMSDIAKREYKDDVLECSRHIHSAITNLVSWGMRGIQRVSFSGNPDVNWEEVGLLPAMVVHGVKTKTAIGLRMINIPRTVAEGLSQQATAAKVPLEALSAWVKGTSDDDWKRALPQYSKLKGNEAKRLWEVVSGSRKMENLLD